jgi:glycosyl hydrolase family 99
MRRGVSRRSFVQSAALAAAGVLTGAASAAASPLQRRSLLEQFSDLPRHFIFEYYPWYRTDPWEHWPEGGTSPPDTFGSNYVPALGLYDSRSTAVMERHARWIAEAGVGAIDVSWWGPDSNVNEVIPVLMDVMAAHDIHVTFYIEPYAPDHAQNYARDVLYLIRNYGDRRHWDGFLLLERADGSSGPVFKSFRTILLPTSTDCHGVTTPVSDYATDDVWRRQTDAIRETLRGDFDRLTLLADSSQVARTQAGGFDGIALFDNYVSPDVWPLHAENCTTRNLVFSFQVNPGFDSIVWPSDPGSCYTPPAFAPGGGVYDWTRGANRAAAEAASRGRIVDSFRTTVRLQTSPALTNARQGFFLVYINSFNEWHEGHMFEPMKNAADLSPAEQAIGYHNPAQGDYRLRALSALLTPLVSGAGS